jgi:DNA-binding MarR family transcriptional regulator
LGWTENGSATKAKKMMEKNQGLAEMAQEIALNLHELRRALRKPMEDEAARAGLTWPQRNVMQVLVQSEGMSLKELSKQVGLAHATVSGIVDRLEKRGLAERRQDPSDRRFTKIVMSGPVRRFMKARLRTLTIDPLQQALQRATPAERKIIREGLQTLRRVMGEPRL